MHRGCSPPLSLDELPSLLTPKLHCDVMLSNLTGPAGAVAGAGKLGPTKLRREKPRECDGGFGAPKTRLILYCNICSMQRMLAVFIPEVYMFSPSELPKSMQDIENLDPEEGEGM